MRTAMTKTLVLSAFSALVGLAAGCRSKTPGAKALAHSVGTVRVVRPAVTLTSGGGKKTVGQSQRLSDGTKVAVGSGGRALVSMDRGAVILLDQDTKIQVYADTISLLRGRIYVEAGAEFKVRAGQGILRAGSTGFDVRVGKDGAVRVYCAAGEVFYQAKGQGRFKSIGPGITLSMAGEKAAVLPEEVWDDWTSGMARAGEAGQGAPAGIGILEGRRVGSLGTAPDPLILRDHRVLVTLDQGFARTVVTQTFFNPKSWPVEGFYRVRLPAGAIVESLFHGPDRDDLVRDTVVARSRSPGAAMPSFLLEKVGQGLYSGRVSRIEPGKIFVVRIVYGQWLEQGRGELIYRYPMGGVDAPLVSEFSLEVALDGQHGKGIRASLDAKVEGGKVRVTRSDFKPRSDFVLELPDKGGSVSSARYAAARDGRERKVFRVEALLPLPAGDHTLDVVIVADRSAGLSDAQAQLVADSLAAVLDQLKMSDRVAVLAVSDDVADLGPGLQGAGHETRKRLLETFSRLGPAGATNLALALRRATALLPKGQGLVLYLGDGRPTTGPRDVRDILTQVRRRDASARLFALGVGSDADMAFLKRLVGEPNAAVQVENPQQAAAAVFRLLARAARPALRQVTVSFDGDVARVYPSRPVVVTGDRPLEVLARSNGKLPSRMIVDAVTGKKPFHKVYRLAFRQVKDQGDLTRRWAQARVQRLLEEDAGREMVADLGVRYGLGTDWTAFASPNTKSYLSLLFGAPPARVRAESLTGVRRVALSNLSVEPSWFGRRGRGLSWNWLYGRLLEMRAGPVRLCFERKASVHPELSGVVDLKMEFRQDGSFKSVETRYSSLGDPEVVSCIQAAVSSLRLPTLPPGAPTTFTHRFEFVSPLAWSGGDGGCSKASRRYLSVRRMVWRERLAGNSGVSGALRVWHGARTKCELKTWLDRQILLDLILVRLRNAARKVAFYNALLDGSARRYVRRRILATLRTKADVVAAIRGLNPDGMVDWTLLDEALGKEKTDAGRLAVVRRFLALAPESVGLRRLAMRLAARLRRFDEAERYAESLRRDVATDVVTRLEIGRLFLGRGRKADARAAMSEVVESAPTDPFARRMLARAYLQQGWCDESAREYQVLLALTPADPMAKLGLAQAALCGLRLDMALRLMAEVASGAELTAARGAPAAARVLLSQTLALLGARRLQDKEASGKSPPKEGKKGAQGGKPSGFFGEGWLVRLEKRLAGRNRGKLHRWLASLRRRVGQATWGGRVLVIAEWRSVSGGLRLSYQQEGQELRRASLDFPVIGVTALRLGRLDGNPYVEVSLLDRGKIVAAIPVLLTVVTGEGGSEQTIWTRTVTLDGKQRVLAFRLEKGRLIQTKVRAKPKKESKP